MDEGRVVYWVLVGKPEGVDGRIILRMIFGKWDVGVWIGLNWLRIGRAGEHLRMW
jgi:hypothetical protein